MHLHSMAASVARAEGVGSPCPIAPANIDMAAIAARLNAQAAIAKDRGRSVLPGILRGYAEIAAAMAADPEPLL